jgi:hypothetical protein
MEYESSANNDGTNFKLFSANDVALSLSGLAHPFLIVDAYPITSVVVANTADCVKLLATR